ncbi:DUF3489 domain-containing protein [Pseudohalocynthiibacter aestuariivivens]|nr:DUF3489 domain-containing protein [Pseudohalocynthiibacter aestuariivivens]QIE45193.1 DUF3489 domain-containing protein [Pseudohalocynthiibacter aestuariivivens]
MASTTTSNRTANDAADRKALVTGKASKQHTTKKQRLQALLRRKGGASLDALQKEFGWQPHTVRAAISGVRKAGNTVVCITGKSGSVYRIVATKAAQ